MIKANSNRYSISAICKLLKVSRVSIYYTPIKKSIDSKLENQVIQIFKDSENNYGTRKIKAELNNNEVQVSKRKIGRIMKKYGLVSKYTVKQFKVHRSKCNEDNIINIVNQNFQYRDHLEVVVSDLTYVNVNGKWHYICILVDPFLS